MFGINKIKHVIKIEFDGVAGVEDWNKELPIPKFGEEVFFDIWKKGRVLNISHRLEGKTYTTSIRVGEWKVKNNSK